MRKFGDLHLNQLESAQPVRRESLEKETNGSGENEDSSMLRSNMNQTNKLIASKQVSSTKSMMQIGKLMQCNDTSVTGSNIRNELIDEIIETAQSAFKNNQQRYHDLLAREKEIGLSQINEDAGQLIVSPQ